LLQRAEHACCERIGDYGHALLRQAATARRVQTRGRLNILTHCNAGWLATGAWGTALAPVYRAWREGVPLHVWVDETRPRNQGARLTAWELREAGIPHTLIVDNAAGHLMQRGEVDLCLVGSDRTTRAGDVCNKIGTYQKALAAGDNGVPFYVALPRSTIDWTLVDGLSEIPIESRSLEEVLRMEGVDDDGALHCLSQTPAGCAARNPAFDVTPARLVSGLICEYGVFAANEQALAPLQAMPDALYASSESAGDFPGVVHGLS
jgi:methylthioribose-1-phosphate isomerase